MTAAEKLARAAEEDARGGTSTGEWHRPEDVPAVIESVRKCAFIRGARWQSQVDRERMERLEEFREEVALGPWKDSDAESLLRTLASRAKALAECRCGHPRGWHRKDVGACLECICCEYVDRAGGESEGDGEPK